MIRKRMTRKLLRLTKGGWHATRPYMSGARLPGGDRGLALVLSGTGKRIDDLDTVEFAMSLHVF
jgi:hypothetical protein